MKAVGVALVWVPIGGLLVSVFHTVGGGLYRAVFPEPWAVPARSELHAAAGTFQFGGTYRGGGVMTVKPPTGVAVELLCDPQSKYQWCTGDLRGRGVADGDTVEVLYFRAPYKHGGQALVLAELSKAGAPVLGYAEQASDLNITIQVQTESRPRNIALYGLALLVGVLGLGKALYDERKRRGAPDAA